MLDHALQHMRALSWPLWLALSLLSLLLSLLLVAWVVVRLPEDALLRAPVATGPRWRRWLVTLGRSLAGLLLVLAGAVLALPGVPGQGLLTMLVGLVLLEFPGRQRLLRLLLRQPLLLVAADRWRARWQRPPLQRPPSQDPAA